MTLCCPSDREEPAAGRRLRVAVRSAAQEQDVGADRAPPHREWIAAVWISRPVGFRTSVDCCSSVVTT